MLERVKMPMAATTPVSSKAMPSTSGREGQRRWTSSPRMVAEVGSIVIN